MNNLKEKLLSLGIFIDNEYLDSYCLLISKNLKTEKCKGLTERHHIIQRAYYKENNLEVDNSKDNIINISHFEHCLAHYYLCLCTTDKFSYLNEYAFIKMVKIKSRFEFNFESFLQQADKYNEVYASFIAHQAEKTKQRPGSIKGKHCYSDGTKIVYADSCPENFYPSSANKGKKFSESTRLKMSEAAKIRCSDPEYRKKMSEAQKGKHGTVIGKIWITNGIEEKYLDKNLPIPNNWYRGRCKASIEKNKHHKSNNGLKLISNGIDQKYINLSTSAIPDGWYLGGSKKYKEQSRAAFALGREKIQKIKFGDTDNNEKTFKA